MNLSDMIAMAQKAGLNPHLPRQQLKSNMIKEFKAYNRNNRRNILGGQPQTIELAPNNPHPAETIKILRDY